MAKKQYSEILINAFMFCRSGTEIQRTANIGRRKYDNLRKDPDFQEILNERKAAFTECAVEKMREYFAEDVDILQKIIRDDNTAAQTRVSAINVLMNQLSAWQENVDVIQRLNAVEKVMNEQK